MIMPQVKPEDQEPKIYYEELKSEEPTTEKAKKEAELEKMR